jgi:hypothetical protein
MTHPNLVGSMMDPTFYPQPVEHVELIQTHISYIFIAGDFVYKVKKPVNFGFLDFTSLEKRQYFCEKEIELNRRLAPQAYLEVIPVYADSLGKLRLGKGPGEIVEYTVMMIKLPQDRMLKHLLSKKKAGIPEMKRIAEKIAHFHSKADTGGNIDEMGRADLVKFNWDENFEQTKKYIDVVLTLEKYDFIHDYVHSFMEREKFLFERRIIEQKIRDCHGDLHLEHICLTDGIVIFDCIEFNERFRYSDTASEVAFLAMDLDFNGYSNYADVFVEKYIEKSGDRDLALLLNFYRCYRAYVRAKVVNFRLDESELSQGDYEALSETAGKYYDLAFRYAAKPTKPVFILFAGLMGTGKSVLSKRIAPFLNAEIIRTDVLRKEMLNLDLAERHFEDFGQGIYSEQISENTYDLALKKAQQIIVNGKSVIIDASYKRRKERQKAQEMAQRLGVDFFIIECVCPESEIRKRLERRLNKKTEPSDGRWQLYELQKGDFEKINERGLNETQERKHIVIDTCLPIDKSVILTLRGIRL